MKKSLQQLIADKTKDPKVFSQRKLAHLSGVSNSTISRIASGEIPKPATDTLKKLSPYLGVSLSELMQTTGHAPAETNNHTQAPHMRNPLDDVTDEDLDYLEKILHKIRQARKTKRRK